MLEDINSPDFLCLLKDAKTANRSFETLVSKTSEVLYWKIRSMVFTHEDSNDVLQNVWIKAWSNLASYRGDAKLSSWLFRIAINESINLLNKEKNQLNMDDSEFNDYMISQLQSDSYFDGDEATIKLEKAVLSLPEKQKLVFQMKYFQEMKYSEMSEILETSEGALKASYHHAVKKIEEIIQGD